MVGVLIALFIGSAIILITPQNFVFGSVSEGDEVSRTTGHSLHDLGLAGDDIFTLLDTSNLTSRAGWLTKVTLDNDYGVNAMQEINGLNIDGAGAWINLYYYLNINVEDYDTLNFTLSVESVQDEFILEMNAYFRLLWLGSLKAENRTNIEHAGQQTLTLNVSMDWLRNSTSSWITQVRFEIWLHLETYSSPVIRHATATASSSRLLFPLLIDFQDLSENSIYDQPETRYLIRDPLINITSISGNETGLLIQWTNNELIFLPSGNYSISYGWLKLHIYNSKTHMNYTHVDSFALTLDAAGRFMEIRPPITRIDLDINEGILFSIFFEDPYSSSIDFIYYINNYVAHSKSAFYIPDMYATIRVEITLKIPQYPSLARTIDIDESHDLILHSRFPYHPVLDLLVSFHVSLRKAMKPFAPTGWTCRERLLPTLLMFISYILPWAASEQVVSSNIGVINFSRIYFLPAGIEILKNEQGSAIASILGISNP